MRVIQFLASYSIGDAQWLYAQNLHRALKSVGISSCVYAQSYNDTAKHYRKYVPKTGDIGLLHLSTGSDINLFFAQLPIQKRIIFHNITPAKFFEQHDMVAAFNCEQGWRHVELFRSYPTVVLSDFSAHDLERLGYTDVRMIPFLYSPKSKKKSLPKKRGTSLLYVGRIAPHKNIHGLLSFFYVYQKYYDEHAKLHIVGSMNVCPSYTKQLHAFVDHYELNSSVTFHGFVSDREKKKQYMSASHFVTFSFHEGFCLPLIEAMEYGLPILAHKGSAMSQTSQGGAFLISHEDSVLACEVIEHTKNMSMDYSEQFDVYANVEREIVSFIL